MTIVFLALLTLVEGVRRVPRGSVVLHRVLFGHWTVEPPEAGDRVRLLSWWSPLMSTIDAIYRSMGTGRSVEIRMMKDE